MNDGPKFELEEVECQDHSGLASSAGTSSATSGCAAPAGVSSSPRSGKLNRADRVAIRMISAGLAGVLTSELFAGLYIAKYTNALSEMRLRDGHQYKAEKVGKFPGGIETTQWRYIYQGFTGDRSRMRTEVISALDTWTRKNL